MRCAKKKKKIKKVFDNLNMYWWEILIFKVKTDILLNTGIICIEIFVGSNLHGQYASMVTM